MEKYEIVKKLGEGGFGKVYLTKDKATGKQYVVKQIDGSQLQVASGGGRKDWRNERGPGVRRDGNCLRRIEASQHHRIPGVVPGNQ
eukprot:1315043-Amorphochlora_amoeboformis.AAC.1